MQEMCRVDLANIDIGQMVIRGLFLPDGENLIEKLFECWKAFIPAFKQPDSVLNANYSFV